jgi:hypothetical protein
MSQQAVITPVHASVYVGWGIGSIQAAFSAGGLRSDGTC